MPTFRMQRQEQGCMYTTYEIIADNKEDAREMIWDGEAVIISQHFKQHDAEELSFEEV